MSMQHSQMTRQAPLILRFYARCFLYPYEELGYEEGRFPLSEKYAKEIISLPMFAELTENEIKFVCEKISEFFND